MIAVRLDHLVVAAASLADGIAWTEARLGYPPDGGGRHGAMGTHNALWRLGEVYLEVIAVDPNAPRPDRPRWFGFDDPQVERALAREPRLLTWAIATQNPEDLARLAERAPAPHDAPTPFARDGLRWQVTLPAGRDLPLGGAWPLMIAWTEGRHPAKRLPDRGLALRRLEIAGDGAAEAGRGLGEIASQAPVDFLSGDGPTRLMAEIDTPGGRVRL